MVLFWIIMCQVLVSCTRKDEKHSNMEVLITEIWFDYHYMPHKSYTNSSSITAPEDFSFTVQIKNNSDSSQRIFLRDHFDEDSISCSYFKMILNADTVNFSFVPKEILISEDTSKSVAVALPFTSYLKLSPIFFNNLREKEKITKVLEAEYM